MAEYVYVNIKETSFKIWGYDFCLAEKNAKTILFMYRGRIGLPMEKLQRYKKVFDTLLEAEQYLKEALQRRKYKKYVKVKYYPYFKLISANKPLWEVLRYIEITQISLD